MLSDALSLFRFDQGQPSYVINKKDVLDSDTGSNCTVEKKNPHNLEGGHKTELMRGCIRIAFKVVLVCLLLNGVGVLIPASA